MEDYAGVYLLMEKIKRGRDRVVIQKSSPTGDSNSWFRGGYIFKKDRLNPGERGFVSSRLGIQFAFEDPKERDLFLKYAAGYNGKPPIQSKFVDYFRANQTTGKYVIPEETPSGAMSPTATWERRPTVGMN